MAEERNDVMDIFEKAFLLGVGAFSLTKDKVDETVNDLVERGRISRDEGRTLVEEMGDRGEKERSAFTGFIRDEMRKAFERADLATKQDIARLEAEIAVLRAQVVTTASEVIASEDLTEGEL
jgi:polyhydroxyalkanoate synthesis regulator phasin